MAFLLAFRGLCFFEGVEIDKPLTRGLGLWTVIALIVGQVVAVGIFLTPAGMARSVGSPFWLIVVWVATAGMTLCGALTYAELASRYPEAGGTYAYLREAYGRPAAFLYGWMNLLVLDPGLTALLAVGLSEYASYIKPMSSGGRQALAIGTIVCVGTVNILGTRLSANFLTILTTLKLVTLAVIIVYGFGSGLGNWSHFTPFISMPQDKMGAFAGGLMGAFFAFAGWWEVTRIAGEVKDAHRNIPRALIMGILIITCFYVLTSLAFFYLVHPSQIVNDQAFAAQAGEVMFGNVGGGIFAGVVVLSVAGSLLAYLMASPRVYYAMAQDGLFFHAFGRLHPRFETPHLAILVQMAMAALLILVGSFQQILSYFFFVVVLFVAMAAAGIFRMRHLEHNGYRTPGYPLTPVFFLVMTAVVLMLIAVQNPMQTAMGILVVMLGLPVYYFIFARTAGTSGLDKDGKI